MSQDQKKDEKEKNFFFRGNLTGGGEDESKRTSTNQILKQSKRFFFFPRLHKTFTLHVLGTGHAGTLETTNRSADPPGDYVPPDHRPPIHGDERQPYLLHGEVPHEQSFL